MSNIRTLVENEKYLDAIGIPETELEGRDFFFLVSSYLALSQGQKAMDVLCRHRDELYQADPLLTLKANFETRFLLKQFAEAEEDLKYFENLPYVSQKVEEALRALPSTIAATRYASSPHADYEKTLETLSSPSDDLMLLSALHSLKNMGELEDYRGLVEELLVGPWHDDVKSYALMLLSAKGSTHETTLVKRGKSYTLIPSKLGTPFAMEEYRNLRKRIEDMEDASLSRVAGELLDLYALICYPERFIAPHDEDAFFPAIANLARSYLNLPEEALEGKSKRYREEIERLIAENPPLLG